MRKAKKLREKGIEQIVQDILRSRARSRIYIYLLRKNGARTEQIIKGTHLHPSTVRETLSQMYDQKLIFRKKIKNDSIGKNPYMYYPIPPIELLKRHTQEIEDRLNNLANLALSKDKTKRCRPVKIKIYDIQGRIVEIITDKSYDADNHRVIFNGSNLASGIYFINARIIPANDQLRSHNFIRKIMVLK